MTEKKTYSTPVLYEVPLDHEQAILTACSLTTMSPAAGALIGNGCRVNGRCEGGGMGCDGSPGGCKRSTINVSCMGVTCHDSGIRPS
jgi:hypothetical protein